MRPAHSSAASCTRASEAMAGWRGWINLMFRRRTCRRRVRRRTGGPGAIASAPNVSTTALRLPATSGCDHQSGRHRPLRRPRAKLVGLRGHVASATRSSLSSRGRDRDAPHPAPAANAFFRVAQHRPRSEPPPSITSTRPSSGRPPPRSTSELSSSLDLDRGRGAAAESRSVVPVRGRSRSGAQVAGVQRWPCRSPKHLRITAHVGLLDRAARRRYPHRFGGDPAEARDHPAVAEPGPACRWRRCARVAAQLGPVEGMKAWPRSPAT